MNEFISVGVDDLKFTMKKVNHVKNKDNIVFKEKGNVCKLTQTLYFFCGGVDSDVTATIELVDHKVYIMKKQDLPLKIYGH